MTTEVSAGVTGQVTRPSTVTGAVTVTSQQSSVPSGGGGLFGDFRRPHLSLLETVACLVTPHYLACDPC